MDIITITAEMPPLRIDVDGSIRVGQTRVLFDLVVQAFRDGAVAEEIVYQYSSLSLNDVYGAISYYLNHRTEIEAYLQRREEEAAAIREKIEQMPGRKVPTRAELLARLKDRNRSNKETL